MSLITNVLLVCVLCVALYKADDLQVGSAANGQLGYQEKVKLSSILLTTRVKNVFWNSNNTKIIKVSLLLYTSIVFCIYIQINFQCRSGKPWCRLTS